MTTQKTNAHRKSSPLDTLRFFTTVASSVMGKPMSSAHRDAIAHYAARKLPARTLRQLRSKSGGTAALQFIVRTLEQPQLSR